MAVANTSSAYKLSVYETVPKRKAKPELTVVRQRSAKRAMASAFTPRALGSFAIVVTLICLMIYNQVCLTEVTGEINDLQSGLTQLESEYVKISSELESMISLQTVAERAKTDLGMNRLDKFQTEYVSLYEGDTIRITEHAPAQDVGDGAKLAARSIIDSLLEYIGQG